MIGSSCCERHDLATEFTTAKPTSRHHRNDAALLQWSNIMHNPLLSKALNQGHYSSATFGFLIVCSACSVSETHHEYEPAASVASPIIGGVPASVVDLHYQAEIVFGTLAQHLCGGSLINERWILTAAHCVQSVDPGVLTVNLGLRIRSAPDSWVQSRTVNDIVMHPAYNPFTGENDVALLRLQAPVVYTDRVQPIKLRSTSPLMGGTNWVSGWGDTMAGGSSADVLQTTWLPVVDSRICNGAGTLSRFVTDDMLCAGFKNGSQGACHGDSGGPLTVFKYPGPEEQIGIVSWGDPNCGSYTIFADVHQFSNWIDTTIYIRDFMALRDEDGPASLNSDGLADICGRDATGIKCALSNGSAFGAISSWSGTFSDANGWSAPAYYSSVRFPDVNGDGMADVCGRNSAGINCGLGTGSAFGAVSLWGGSGFRDLDGWREGPAYYSTLGYPDVNGDGKSDVCGRSSAGITCSISTGTAFGAASLWVADFTDAGGWGDNPKYYSTIRYPDLNGDGKADVCMRGAAGIRCSLSTGTAFGNASLWTSAFGDAAGWGSDPKYYSTLAFPDLNGDGKDDICMRGSGGITCAVSTGTTFGTAALWAPDYVDGDVWDTNPRYYGTLRFPDMNGDGMADICARYSNGIWCTLSTGTAFGPPSLRVPDFVDGDGNSWGSSPRFYSTIRFRDVTGDGKADICMRGSEGVFCAVSTGSAFNRATLWSSNFNDAQGWRYARYYSTIHMP